MKNGSAAAMPQNHRVPQDERGTVLIVAMGVMSVALALGLLVVSVAINSGQTTGHDRQRLVAVNAAEAGIDSAYATIQSSALALPCNWPSTGSANVSTYPDTASYAATVTYYDGTGATLTCPPGGTLPTTMTPARATIASVGTTGPGLGGTTGQRKMEALVNLLPIGGGTLNKALTGAYGVSITNNATINGNVGADGDIYTNGNYFCGNSPEVHGNIYAPYGSIQMDNTCTALGDVWAHNSVILNGNKTIGGNVRSAQGSITADGNTNVNGTLIARGTIGWSGCTPSKCMANQSTVPEPPSQPFPIIRGDQATLDKWTAAGYTVIRPPGSIACTDLDDYIDANAAGWTGKTLVYTPCLVNFSKTKDITFGGDFALFAYGGIITSNQVSFASSVAGSARQVQMIVPYEAVSIHPCNLFVPPMSTANNFSSTSDITLLWYSPCSIVYANNGGSYGAIYSGGTVSTSNQFSLTYRPIAVAGIDPATQPTLSYKVDIIYKREDRIG